MIMENFNWKLEDIIVLNAHANSSGGSSEMLLGLNLQEAEASCVQVSLLNQLLNSSSTLGEPEGKMRIRKGGKRPTLKPQML